ncbi:MAG: Maf family protein [Candidatus Kapaibacteriales bacterium]
MQKIKIADLLQLRIPLILASSSPRRKKLLDMLGLEFSVIHPNIDEDKAGSNIYDYSLLVTEVARAKANAVAEKINEEAIIIGADTIVVHDGKVLNKPSTPEEAKQMLLLLSNHTHIVFTGIAFVHFPTLFFKTCFRRTEVTFRRLSLDEIDAYIQSGSPMDKAGAYGIQDDFGAVLVRHINGCFYNVIGLPLECFYTTLSKFINEIELQR